MDYSREDQERFLDQLLPRVTELAKDVGLRRRGNRWHGLFHGFRCAWKFYRRSSKPGVEFALLFGYPWPARGPAWKRPAERRADEFFFERMLSGGEEDSGWWSPSKPNVSRIEGALRDQFVPLMQKVKLADLLARDPEDVEPWPREDPVVWFEGIHARYVAEIALAEGRYDLAIACAKRGPEGLPGATGLAKKCERLVRLAEQAKRKDEECRGR